MKKIFKLLFATLLTLSLLVACGGTGNGETDDEVTPWKAGMSIFLIGICWWLNQCRISFMRQVAI